MGWDGLRTRQEHSALKSVNPRLLHILSRDVAMEAGARQWKHPGVGTSHDPECRRTAKTAAGGGKEGRKAVAGYAAQQQKLRLQNSGVVRKESRERWMPDSGTVSVAACSAMNGT